MQTKPQLCFVGNHDSRNRMAWWPWPDAETRGPCTNDDEVMIKEWQKNEHDLDLMQKREGHAEEKLW